HRCICLLSIGEDVEECQMALQVRRDYFLEQRGCVFGCPPTEVERPPRTSRIVLNNDPKERQRAVDVAFARPQVRGFPGNDRSTRVGVLCGFKSLAIAVAVTSDSVGRRQIEPIPGYARIEFSGSLKVMDRSFRVLLRKEQQTP